MRPEESAAEGDGWFTVARAASLLGVTVPRIFDQIRDGRLQVRFEPGNPGETERPLVTSAELKQKLAPVALLAPAAVPPLPHAAAVAAPPSDEMRRTIARLESELRETRETFEAAERKLDASLQAIYERDVKIARLDADVAARERLRDEERGMLRQVEARLDKSEKKSEDKELEIRRLAVGLGEARGEIRLLKPPPPEPVAAWKRHLSTLFSGACAIVGAGLVGWIAYALATKTLVREAAVAAGVGVLAAFAAGRLLERLRRTR